MPGEEGTASLSVNPDLETARQLLRALLLRHLEALQPALRQDVLAALSGEGKLLHQPYSTLDGRWALVPFYLASDLHAGTASTCAYGAALAVECVICATDLFDDVMDEDVTPLLEQLGVARVLNVALALVALAQRVLLSPVDQSAPPELSMRLLDAVQHALLLASAGQQRDLLAEQCLPCTVSREECLEIAGAKAGSLLSLACRLGAMCADVDEVRIERCAELGRLLGIAAQLDNDAHDLSHLLQSSDSQKSDLKRGKKTLPVVLAAHSLREMRGLSAVEVDEALLSLTFCAPEEQEIAVSALREGIMVTWGISLLYRERARDCLHEIGESKHLSPSLHQVLGLDRLITQQFEPV